MDDMLMGVRDARRLGLLEAARRGDTTNRKAARALGLSLRQFQRLKPRVAAQGPRGCGMATNDDPPRSGWTKGSGATFNRTATGAAVDQFMRTNFRIPANCGIVRRTR